MNIKTLLKDLKEVRRMADEPSEAYEATELLDDIIRELTIIVKGRGK